MQSRSMFFVLSVLLTAMVLIACNRKMETAAVKSEGPPAASQTPSDSAKAEAIPSVQNQTQVPRQVALETPIRFQDAYFDFNKSLIRKNEKDALLEDANLLKENPDMKIKVEGYCDERGTEEYNLVLGNRRAETVRRLLIGLGVEPSRIDTISYGKDKPFCTEHNETCYQENRRGHFVTLTVGN
jgi:peptidoglycan-associated lipoprotein